MWPRSAALTFGFDVAQQGSDEVEEQPNTRRAPLVRAKEHIHGRTTLHLPIHQHWKQASGLQMGAGRQVIQARDALAGEHRVEHDLAAVAAQPTLHFDRGLLGTTLELP